MLQPTQYFFARDDEKNFCFFGKCVNPADTARNAANADADAERERETEGEGEGVLCFLDSSALA